MKQKTKENIIANEIIKVVQAFQNNILIQSRARQNKAKWENDSNPDWNFKDKEFRISPNVETEYIPFVMQNYKEFIDKDILDEINHKKGRIYAVRKYGVIIDFGPSSEYRSFVDLVDFCTFYNSGIPCGKIATKGKDD